MAESLEELNKEILYEAHSLAKANNHLLLLISRDIHQIKLETKLSTSANSILLVINMVVLIILAVKYIF